MENISQPESELEKYRKRNEWAEMLARDLDVSFTGEFFEIPVTGSDGKAKIRRIHAWKKIPLYNEKGEREQTVDIKIAIEATRRFPDMPLSESLKILETSQTDAETDTEEE